MGFRGDGSGVFSGVTPPLHWGPTTNVKWKAPLPALASSSPVVAGGRVFVTAEPTTVLCFDAEDGHLLWQHEVAYLDTVSGPARAQAEKEAASVPAARAAYRSARMALDEAVDELRHGDNSAARIARVGDLQSALSKASAGLAALARYLPPEPVPIWGAAGATPLVDGQRLFVLFGNDVAASFTVEGALRWARHLPTRVAKSADAARTARAQYASPLLADGVLVAPMARLHGLDADSGETRWTGPSYGELGTPGVAHLEGGAVILTPEGAAIRARDGAVLAEGLGRLIFVGPVVDGKTAFYVGSYHSGGTTGLGLARARAVELPARAELPFEVRPRGELELPPRRYFAAPILAGGRLLAVDRDGMLTVFDEAPLRVAETVDTAHPVVRAGVAQAGGYLFITSDVIRSSQTEVIEAHPPWRHVARNELERFTGSPFFSGHRMYVRADRNLYCIEEP